MKDTCSLTPVAGAVPVLRYNGDLLMAHDKVREEDGVRGDRSVATTDTDGRKLPADYDNFAAGSELVQWLIDQRTHLPR